jgi:hypothetical protein
MTPTGIPYLDLLRPFTLTVTSPAESLNVQAMRLGVSQMMMVFLCWVAAVNARKASRRGQAAGRNGMIDGSTGQNGFRVPALWETNPAFPSVISCSLMRCRHTTSSLCRWFRVPHRETTALQAVVDLYPSALQALPTCSPRRPRILWEELGQPPRPTPPTIPLPIRHVSKEFIYRYPEASGRHFQSARFGLSHAIISNPIHCSISDRVLQ